MLSYDVVQWGKPLETGTTPRTISGTLDRTPARVDLSWGRTMTQLAVQSTIDREYLAEPPRTGQELMVRRLGLERRGSAEPAHGLDAAERLRRAKQHSA